MKYTHYIRLVPLAIAGIFFFWGGCKQEDNYNYIISSDKTKPGVVTNVKVDNFHGGAHITYTLPKSDNLLYVLAQYKINDSISRQTKSSYYSDTIEVSGFEKSKDYDVTLYAVSRAEVKSDPVVIKVHPDTPAYLSAFPSIKIKSDFGGVNVSLINSLEQPIGIVLITPDKHNELAPANQVYTDDSSITFSVRGFDTLQRRFGVYVTDPWGNKSDTLFSTLSPLFEMQMDKTKFSELHLPSDALPYQVGTDWTLPHLWDGDVNTGYNTIIPATMPLTFTFDMGVKAKLSRYKIWDRGGIYLAAFGNPKRWAMWGSNEPEDDILPADVSGLTIGQTVGSWIFMGYFVSPSKPSGSPDGVNTPEDIAWNAAGFGYNLSIAIPPVRYIRFQALESFSGGKFIHIMEINLWGKAE